MTNNKILHIPEIPQYGVIVEDPKKIDSSLFIDVYKNAAYCVNKIVLGNKHSQDTFPREEFLNTVISFTGERGSGKSSGMLTFASLLKRSQDKQIWDNVDKNIIGNQFWTLRAIDSTHMGQNEKLLASISARLYQEYKDHNQNGKLASITVDQKRDFLKVIQDVNKLSYMFSQGEWIKEESSLLQNSSELGELRGKVQAMVDSFLNIMFGKCDSSTYLVISIDDLDMNLENSFDIVDDIRKFLTIKHVVVLTSVDIEQLKELVCLHFNKPFGNKAGSTGEVMGQKYIEKIFPITRQMEMSRLSTEELSKRYIGNLLGDGEDTTRENIGLLTAYGDMTYDPYITITHGILHLIYRKTMLLLVPEDNERHWLIPHNLRELCNFIYLLQKMDDVAFNEVDDNGNKKYVLVNDKQLKENKLDIMEDNLRKLMQYIVSDLLDYSTVHMDDETKKMAEVLTKLIRDLPEWTLVTMNKKIVQDILIQVEKSELYQKFYNEQQRKSLLNATYQVHLISMGDVQHVLGALSLRTNDLTIKRLVEYIRVIWSIRMTIEFYCVGLRYNDNEKMKELYENPDENETFCNNGYITKRFREAVGGLIVNPESATLLKLKPECREAHSHEKNKDLMLKGDWIRIHINNANAMKANGIGGIAVLSCSSINSYTINDEKGGTVVVDTVIDGDCNWRALTSKPYYRNNKAICDGYYVYTNYMALFTNLLAIEDIWGDEEFKNICKTWQHDNVIVFPFYSMNWMNRFYKELKNLYENSSEYSTINNAIKDLHNRIKGGLESENGNSSRIKGVVKKMEEITGQYIYIPKPQPDKTIVESSYCFTGNNYTVRLGKLAKITDILDTVYNELDKKSGKGS